MKGFDNLLHFILAGTHTNHSLHYPFLKNLQIEGLVYRQGHWPQYVYLPYHLFLRANETYGRFPKRIEQSVVPRELLPIPGLPYTWDTFKKLDHVLDVSQLSLTIVKYSNCFRQYELNHSNFHLRMVRHPFIRSFKQTWTLKHNTK